jgi:hypothetical protein
MFSGCRWLLIKLTGVLHMADLGIPCTTAEQTGRYCLCLKARPYTCAVLQQHKYRRLGTVLMQ